MSAAAKMLVVAPMLLLLLFSPSTWAQESSTSTQLRRESLESYPLATCNDGTAAVYYRDEVRAKSNSRVVNRKKNAFENIPVI